MKKILFAIAMLLVSSIALADNVLPPSMITVANGYQPTLAWTAVSQGADGSTLTPPVTYKIYAVTTTTSTLLTTVSGVSYQIPTGITVPGQYCWDVTANAVSIEGTPSSIVCATILPVPPPTPKAPTGLGVH